MSKLEIGDFVEVFRMPTSPKVWSLRKSESLWGRTVQWAQDNFGQVEDIISDDESEFAIIRIWRFTDPERVRIPFECLRKVKLKKSGWISEQDGIMYDGGKHYIRSVRSECITFVPEEPF